MVVGLPLSEPPSTVIERLFDRGGTGVIDAAQLEHLSPEERVDAVFDHLGREALRGAAALADIDPDTASRLASIGAAWASAGPELRLLSGRAHAQPSRQLPLLRLVPPRAL